MYHIATNLATIASQSSLILDKRFIVFAQEDVFLGPVTPHPSHPHALQSFYKAALCNSSFLCEARYHALTTVAVPYLAQSNIGAGRYTMG